MNKVLAVVALQVALLAALGSASSYIVLEETPVGYPPALAPGFPPSAYPPYTAYAVPAPVQEIVAVPAPQPTLVPQAYPPVGYQGYSYGTSLQPTGYNYNYVYGRAAPAAVAEPAVFGLGGFPYAYANDWFYRNN